ncbi:MAG: ATP-binding protein [Candidatus Latescibacterota bacterium]
MRIATRLRLAALAPLLMALAIGAAAVVASRAAQSARREDALAHRLIDSANELGGLVHAYLLYPEERPRAQFLAGHDSLATLLAQAQTRRGERQRLLDGMRRSSESVRALFVRLAASADGRSQATSGALPAEARERLAAQVLIRTRDVQSEALQLEALIAEETGAARGRVNLLIILLVVTVTVPLTLVLAGMARGITASLHGLRRGMEVVAGGGLEHRLGMTDRDEIGDLAQAFDRMTQALQETTVSRDALGAQVRERTAALVATVERLQEEVRQRQEAQRQVTVANEELHARAAQLRALAGELTLAEQRERRRLARLLHDHLQQLLVGARFRVTTLGRVLDPGQRVAVDEVDALLDDAISASRLLTAELCPPILHDGGLGPGMEWLARWMGEKHGLTVDLVVEEVLPQPAEDVRVLLFEAARELLFNAVKHAQVRTAAVTVQRDGEDQVKVTVADDGPGFDPAALKPPGALGGGFGLFSIRERLGLVGGHLQIDSTPGQGSRLVLTAPLDPAGSAAPTPG